MVACLKDVHEVPKPDLRPSGRSARLRPWCVWDLFV